MLNAFALPADWNQILERIQRALAQASQLAQDRENAQAECGAGAAGAAGRQELLNTFPNRLARLDASVSQARADIAAVDATLEGAEARFRDFLTTSESLRGRLALWMDRAIG